jgi:hypothetical protein
MKVCAPDGAAREVDVNGRRYRSRDGVYDMAPADAKMLRAAGGFASALNGVAPAGTGFSCVDCGFGSWFTTCSRCGGVCRKAEE